MIKKKFSKIAHAHKLCFRFFLKFNGIWSGVTVFVSIGKENMIVCDWYSFNFEPKEISFRSQKKENCHYDYIPFNLERIVNLFLSVHAEKLNYVSVWTIKKIICNCSQFTNWYETDTSKTRLVSYQNVCITICFTLFRNSNLWYDV